MPKSRILSACNGSCSTFMAQGRRRVHVLPTLLLQVFESPRLLACSAPTSSRLHHSLSASLHPSECATCLHPLLHPFLRLSFSFVSALLSPSNVFVAAETSITAASSSLRRRLRRLRRCVNDQRTIHEITCEVSPRSPALASRTSLTVMVTAGVQIRNIACIILDFGHNSTGRLEALCGRLYVVVMW